MRVLSQITSERFYKKKGIMPHSFQIIESDGRYFMTRNDQSREIKTKTSGPYQSGNCCYVSVMTLGGVQIDEKFHSYY